MCSLALSRKCFYLLGSLSLSQVRFCCCLVPVTEKSISIYTFICSSIAFPFSRTILKRSPPFLFVFLVFSSHLSDKSHKSCCVNTYPCHSTWTLLLLLPPTLSQTISLTPGTTLCVFRAAWTRVAGDLLIHRTRVSLYKLTQRPGFYKVWGLAWEGWAQGQSEWFFKQCVHLQFL